MQKLSLQHQLDAPETRHKDTKKDAHKTNNQATVGLSILKCNLDAEADRRHFSLSNLKTWHLRSAQNLFET